MNIPLIAGIICLSLAVVCSILSMIFPIADTVAILLWAIAATCIFMSMLDRGRRTE